MITNIFCIGKSHFLIILFLLSGNIFGQVKNRLSSESERNNRPSFYTIGPQKNLSNSRSGNILNEYLKPSKSDQLKKTGGRQVDKNFYQEKYQQYHQGIKVEYAVYNVNSKNGIIESIGGEYYRLPEMQTEATISEEAALKAALNFVGAKRYMWEDAQEEEWLKKEKKNTKASFYPKGELVICKDYLRSLSRDQKFTLAYKFNIYSKEPLSRNYIYVDAHQGRVIHKNAIIKHADGTAHTRYSGTRTIGTSLTGGTYVLSDISRGNGIETYNMNGGYSYSSATNFSDNDNNWTSAEHANIDKDDAALDAHWGSTMTYNYFKNVHNRNSYDGNGAKIKSYVHYGTDYINAFWDGYVMTYGDGGIADDGTVVEPLTTIDVAAHEIGHAVCSSTANLVYSYESGALNEGLSDIWGATVEYYADPNKGTWTMGEDMNYIIRSMSNPNEYGDPDTYLGTYWKTGSEDHGGVHSNSGVLNHWYYLLVVGKSGTNDNGEAYNVTGIGIDKASKIVYRMESVYLTSNSQYYDARDFAIQSAIDLYGLGSNEVIQTINAWNAVGVKDLSSAPIGLTATAVSTTEISLSWMDNSDDEIGFIIERSLSSTTNFTAIDTVAANDTLFADKGLATDNIYFYRVCALLGTFKSTYSNQASAIVGNGPVIMSNTNATVCNAAFFDPGGTGNYSSNQQFTMTISPAVSGNKLKVEFTSFSLEYSYDYLNVYDGGSTSSPLIGSYTGNSLPPVLYGTTESGQLTFRFYSDPIIAYSGWEATISCVTSIPLPDLVIQSPSISKSKTIPGNSISGSFYIYNLGESLAKSSNTAYYLSTDTIFQSSDIYLSGYNGSSLAAGTSLYRSANWTIPYSTTPGNYYILFVADPGGILNESNETNNTKQLSLTVEAPARDLLLNSPILNDSDVGEGGMFSMAYNVKNEGNSYISYSYTGYYISTDTIKSNDDTFLDYSFISDLSAEASISMSKSLELPTTISTGNYYILLAADYTGIVTETDENNNIINVPIKVVAPEVDLTIIAYSAPLTSSPGNSVNLASEIFNEGNTFSASSSVGFYLSSDTLFDINDELLGTSWGGKLNNGQIATRSGYFTIPAETTPGTYYVLYFADYDSAVSEISETNNLSYKEITILEPYVDLVLLYPDLSTSSIPAGNTITAYGYILNQGNTSSSSSDIAYYLSVDTTPDSTDILLYTNIGGSLNKDAYYYKSSTLTIPSTISPGNYYIIQKADPENKVVENNKDNNYSYNSLQVTEEGTEYNLPLSGTLSITTCDTKIFDDGGRGEYNNSVNGTLIINPAFADNKVSLTFSSFSVESCCDRLIIYDGNSTASPIIGEYTYNPGTVTATNSTGALTLRWITDGSVTYSGFEAQVSCISLLPDFLITNSFASPDEIYSGGSTVINFNLSNNGLTDADASKVGYYLSSDSDLDGNDILLDSTSVGVQTPGQITPLTTTLVIPQDTPEGDYYIILAADYLEQLSEQDELNNESYLNFKVNIRDIDLRLASNRLSQSSVSPGETFSVWVDISNKGTDPSTSSNLGFYLSSNSTFDSSDLLLSESEGEDLNAESARSVSLKLSIPENTTTGNYFIIFVADPMDLVEETNENNNIVFSKITIHAPNPDLTAHSLTSNIDNLIGGNDVSISFQVENKGALDAAESTIGYFISQNQTFEVTDGLATSSALLPLSSSSVRQIEKTITIPDTLLSGYYYLIIYPDYSGKIDEENEANNTIALSIYVSSPLSDLRATTPEDFPETLEISQKNSFFYKVYNDGNHISSPFQVRYYLSGDYLNSKDDILLSSSAVSPINSYSSTTIEASFMIPVNTTPGEYFILFEIDKENINSEENTGNNFSYKKVQITAPTGIESELKTIPAASVFPNPSKGEFTLEVEAILAESKVELFFYNSLGLKLEEKTLSVSGGIANSHMKVNFPGGAYIIKIKIGDIILHEKFIIE